MEYKKVAEVNDHTIYENQLDHMVNAYKQQFNKKDLSEDERKHILESMIKNYILLDEAKAKNLKVEKKMIDQQVDKIRKRFKTKEDFLQELEKNELKFEDFKEDIKKSLFIQLITDQEIKNKIKLTADMFEEYYKNNEDNMIVPEMVRVKHILVSTQKDKTSDDVKKTARELLKKVKQGADFAAIAKQHSDCPSGEKGGDLGLFPRGQMTAEFDKAAFKLKEKEISDLIETEFGYHIIKAEERKEEKKLSYKDAQPYIEKIIYQQEGQKIVNKLVTELRKKTKVLIY